MTFLKKMYQSIWFIPVVVFLFIAVIIWFAGPYVAFAEYYPLAEISNRLLLLVTLLLIYVLIKGFQYYRSMKLQTQMVEDITDDAGLDEVINAEATDLKRKFEQAFSLLKSSKGTSLTDMPWYMIIGSPGSGKTTLLSNSGLKFPLYKEFSNQAIQGVGGTKNCDWWITQDAVLLDTAGRYTSQDSQREVDESGWSNFLDLIKKYRKKPISGLLVSFSLSDLVTMNDFEIGQLINQTKQRISDINDYFDTRFPVYVVVTKCDMLAGFTQFFENFSHKEREQTFGITFDPKRLEKSSPVGLFSQEFSELVESLERRQWQRISLERDAGRKSLIYSFTSQLSSLKPTLQNVVESLCENDNKLTNGILRGLYFTSGTQHGAPIDRMIAKVSQVFGVRSNAQVLWNNDSRSYFIKEVLQQVIFPESDQFGVLASYEKRKALIKRWSFIGAGVFSILLSIGWFISYNNNVTFIETSETAVENWNEEYSTSGKSGDIRTYLPALNDFSTNMLLLEEQKQASFAGLGLRQSNSLQEGFEASYHRLLKIILLPYVKEQIELQLRQSTNTTDRYGALKAYLMLGNADKRDEPFLDSWFKQLVDNNPQLAEAERIQLNAHAEHLLEIGMPVDTLNDDLVTQTRESLQRTSLTELYYQQFKQPFVTNPDNMLSMDQLAGNQWRTIFSLNNRDEFKTISTLFTPDLLTQVQTTLMAKYMTQLDSESWVLGENNQINKITLAKQLLSVYARDYVKEWQTLLNDVAVRPSRNLQTLENALMVSSGIDSPMLYLLETVAASTDLTKTGVASEAADMATRGNQTVNRLKRLNNVRDNESPSVLITSQFAPIHDVMKLERKNLLQQRLSAVFSEMALSLSAPELQSTEGDENRSLKTLQAIAFTQPKPLNDWLGDLGRSVNGVMNQGNREKIAQAWKQDVLLQCNEIVSYKYPFDKSADVDASARDLANLFSDSGVINQFISQHIQPLLQSRAYPWRWKPAVASSYGFSDSTLAFFERADRIRRSLFSGGGTTPRINLSFKPVYLDSRVAKFTMNLYGRQMSYQFGRPSTTQITWPSENPGAGAFFSFVRQDGSEVMSREKDGYAIFKMFDSASVNSTNKNTIEVTFEKENYKAIYEVKAQEGSNPMVFSQLANFRCIQNL